MRGRIAGMVVVLVGTMWARDHDQKPAETRGENESVVIEARLYGTPESVKEVLGSDLDGHYIVVAVKLTPRFGKFVAITRDDFMLKTDKDGEKDTPFAPSQIAGGGAIVVTQTGGGSTAGMRNNGPIWGGLPGTIGRPRDTGAEKTSTSGEAEGSQAKPQSGSKDKPNPMLAVLKQKELPAIKTDQPVSGLLYFPMEKQRVKDLELRYDMIGDKIVMRFHQAR